MKALSFLAYLLFSSTSLLAQTFTKITTGPLVTTFGDSRSVNWVDVNNDGFIDCLITNGPSGGQNNMLYLNDKNGGFTQVNGQSIVNDGKPSDGASFADTDNDGDLDCFVANWYGMNNLFYINQGSGTFSQVTTGKFVTDGGHSETASWGDYDNDGLVDLYVCNSAGSKFNYLYHNTGNNQFTKITTGSAATDAFASRSVNWTDIDSDGFVDLFVTNEESASENIYKNNGNGTFTTITTGILVTSGRNTMSGSWGDYDNDGDMDVFLANDKSLNGLYRNDGNFTFTAIVDTVSRTPSNSFSSAWSDVDNDGDLDLFVTNSFKTGTLLLNFLYLNDGDGTFTRVNNTSPATDMDWSYGCAFGDYDNDGFQDLAVATCNYNGADRYDLLYHNDGNSNNWFTVKLVGTQSNRAALGARIHVKSTINGQDVWQLREVSGQSAYCSQNDLRTHFGLGNATIIDSIKVEWPSGIKETFVNVDPNQFVTITEGQGLSAVQEINRDTDISLFPNPAVDKVTIRTAQPLKPGTIISVTTIDGKTLHMQTINKQKAELELDLKAICNGISGSYFINISTDSGSIVKKVVRP